MYPGFMSPEWYAWRWGKMRVGDRVLKCTVFLGYARTDPFGKEVFKPASTAFLVSHIHNGHNFINLVTCAHSVQGKELSVRINARDGVADVFGPITPDSWRFHPDSDRRFVDVAVVPIPFDLSSYDIACISTADFCTPEIIDERDVGIGEELFYPSLFTYHAGSGRNLPVMRSGTLSAMPVEPLQTNSGPIRAYLMEGRSISGHSGSPVFLNFLAPRTYYADKAVKLPHPGQSQAYRLLGLVRGFIRADDVGEYVTDEVPKEESLWVNSGISSIIPASEIYETITQPEIVDMMDRSIKEARERGEEVPASISVEKLVATQAASDVAANPAHREDFTRLVDAASRKKPPAD
jgi:hypothetical protein